MQNNTAKARIYIGTRLMQGRRFTFIKASDAYPDTRHVRVFSNDKYPDIRAIEY